MSVLDLEPGQVSDEELTALALAASPDAPLSADAVPFYAYDIDTPQLLPGWYMPPVLARRARGWRVPVVVFLVAAFLLVDAFGLCMTYGQITAA